MTEEEINKRIDAIIHPEILSPLFFVEYATDLNSCRDFELWMQKGDWKTASLRIKLYMEHLARVLGCMSSATFRFAHASSMEKCEAFLRSNNAWKN